MQEPMITITVGGVSTPFMVDTGARYSTIQRLPPGAYVTNDVIPLVGFKGEEIALPKTSSILVSAHNQLLTHSFILAPSSPANLLGRDLMCKLCPLIKCSADGLQLMFPDGSSRLCLSATNPVNTMFPVHAKVAVVCMYADIFWVVMDTDAGQWTPVETFWTKWSPWVRHLRPYDLVSDALHCTLYYDRMEDTIFLGAFQEVEGLPWDLSLQDLYVGPQGVAWAVSLTPEQQKWYRMDDPPDPPMPPCYPHVSLAVSPKHTQKDLGPFVKACIDADDWKPTFYSGLHYSASLDSYRILSPEFVIPSVLEHSVLDRHHGRETSDSDLAPALIDSLPDSLWTQGPTDVGRCDVTPVTFQMKPGPIWVPQYPVPAKEKKGTGKWRMVHDLRAINAAVTTPTLPVPNPHAALSLLSPSHTHFTVIDLANAFFSIPLHPSMKPYLAFTWDGRRYSYNCLPMGFLLSPGLFNVHLRELLKPLSLPPGVLLVQYVDDLLVAAPSEQSCLDTTHSLLLRLHEVGLKVSKSKIQVARTQVSFLGRCVSRMGTGLSSSHREDILHSARPSTVKQMLAFLGLCNYSRHHVVDFSECTHPLRAMVKEVGMRNLSAALAWTPDADAAFSHLKACLASATSLSIPDYNKMFFLDVAEKASSVSAVLFQKGDRGERNVCMYVSTPLDNYEKRQTPCSSFASALARLVQKTAHVVLHHPLTIRTGHSTVQYITSQFFTMTGGRQRKIESVITQPHIIFIHEGINMADGLIEGGQVPIKSLREPEPQFGF
ncbi:uncharacterized protein [Antennarius striatus]|uniref:uncharacterized protein n=1 Tax=Antennarius striatus TaxID=241820 RepID=UPI0035B09EEE